MQWHTARNVRTASPHLSQADTMTPRDIQNTRTQRTTNTTDIARRIARARLAQRLAALERVADGPDAHRIPACDLAAIRAEIARTRAAMRALASS
jgi:hypothetical protein